MSQRSPFLRHVNPKPPEGPLMRLWGHVGAGIVYVLFGIVAVVWNLLTITRTGRRKRSLRYLDDL